MVSTSLGPARCAGGRQEDASDVASPDKTITPAVNLVDPRHRWLPVRADVAAALDDGRPLTG